MPESKAKCKKCGVELPQLTAEGNDGMCMRCRYPWIYTNVEVQPGRHVDWMCIDLHRDFETADYADYFFSASVTDKDPRLNTHMCVGHNVGLLRIIKATGETQLLYPMAEDEGDRRYRSAARRIWKHWQKGEFPQRTQVAGG